MIKIVGKFGRKDGSIVLNLALYSVEKDGLGDKFAIKFNKNTFALAPLKASFGLLEENRQVDMNGAMAVRKKETKRERIDGCVVRAC